MGLIAIGPVVISHGNPTFSSDSSPVAHGIDVVSIGGTMSWAAYKTIKEMTRNPTPGASQTIDGFTGVRETMEFDDDLLEDWNGYYLIQRFTMSAAQQDSLTATDVPFLLTAAFVGPVT